MKVPNEHNFLNNATRKMYGDQKVFSHAAYLFVTKRSAAFKDVDFSSEAVKIFEEQIENFQSKISTLKPVRMSDNDWVHYLDSVFALDHSDSDKVLFDVDFEKQEFGDYKFVGYTVNGDKCIKEYDYCLRNSTTNGKRETLKGVIK
ncbi:hypothetical protein FACS189452_10690 [Bacteroidia bacterium]|nr:hypothetical protein FACS189452_10690 [Bacteroidia bacterium]